MDAANNKQRTPLHCACVNGHEVVAQLLLVRGAMVDAADHEQETPLHYACFNGHKAVA